MNIIAIALGAYPEGEATTNRVLSIMRGLVELDNIVELLILAPTRKILKGKRLKEGNVNGVHFKYISKNIFYPKSKIKWISDLLLSIIKSLSILSKAHKNKRLDAILILVNEPIIIIPYLLFAKINNIKIFHEQTETPEISYRSTFADRIVFNTYIFLLKKMNGVYVISSYLREFFARFISDEKICVINMTVDPFRFSNKKDSPYKFNYIAYCGTMYGEKDGVNNLLEAYYRVRKESNLKLVLIGDITDKRVDPVKIKINDLDLADDVVLTGSISSEQVPNYLLNAHILVLARPDNIQAKAGFPTKLGEYLLCEKPVIVTDVGDISKFLKDRESIFLSKPGDIKQFVEKIHFIVDNYNLSIEIAKRGKEVALKHFHYLKESRKLLHFLETS